MNRLQNTNSSRARFPTMKLIPSTLFYVSIISLYKGLWENIDLFCISILLCL
jgi:hypothetical protein